MFVILCIPSSGISPGTRTQILRPCHTYVDCVTTLCVHIQCDGVECMTDQSSACEQQITCWRVHCEFGDVFTFANSLARDYAQCTRTCVMCASLRLARERLRRLRGVVPAAVLPAASAAPRTTAVHMFVSNQFWVYVTGIRCIFVARGDACLF